MAFMCPHLIEQYYVKVSEILYTYKPQIVLLVKYKDVSDGLMLRGSLRKEEHEVIIKMKNSKSQVEALLLIIPKRMWGLESLITVLIDQNVSVWLTEELFQAYVRHLVTSIKKQQAEKKCECLQLKDGSYFRRRWIQLLKIFDAWIFNVGTSLGFMSQTLYPVNNSLAFINSKLPLPLPRMTTQQLLQLQNSSVDYSDDQSVIVTEVDDDDVFEQGDTSPANNQTNQIIGMIPRETIAKPFRAITNGLIITPLKALNLSLTRSVDCLTNLTSSTLQISEATTNKCADAYPLHKITSGTNSEALVSVRANMMSPSFNSHIFSNSLSQFAFNPSSGSLENTALNSSALARVSQKYSIGATNGKIPLRNGSATSPTTSPPPKGETKPLKSNSIVIIPPKVETKPPKSNSVVTIPPKDETQRPKSTSVVSPSRISTSTTKSVSSTPIKAQVAPNKLVRSSTTLAQSSPSLLKSSAPQKPSISTAQPKTSTVVTKSPVSTIKPSTKSATTESIPELFEDFASPAGGEFDIVEIEANPELTLDPNTRSVGTNTIFHHSTVQQNNVRSTSTSPTNKPKSASVSSPLYQRTNSVTPRLSQPLITLKTSPTNKENPTTTSSTLNRSSSSVATRTSPRLADPSVKLRTTIPQTKSEISIVNRRSDPFVKSKLSMLDKIESISQSATTLNQSTPTLSNPVKTLEPEIPRENEIKLISIPETIKSPESPTFSNSTVLSQSSPKTDETKDTTTTTETSIPLESQKFNDPISTLVNPSASVESPTSILKTDETKEIPVMQTSIENSSEPKTMDDTKATIKTDETNEIPLIQTSNENSSEPKNMDDPKTTIKTDETKEIPLIQASSENFSEPKKMDEPKIAIKTDETKEIPLMQTSNENSPEPKKMDDPIVCVEIPSPILSSQKLSDEGISMSSSETVNFSTAGSVGTISDDAANDEDSVTKISLSKSSSLPNSKSSSKATSPTNKGIVKRSISSVFDRLSKPKTKPTVLETQEKSSVPTEKKAVGRKDLIKSIPAILKKSSESKSETSLAADGKKTVASKTAKKIVPPRPKFSTSTKIKAPPPPPPLYDRLAPEDYASQQFNIEWLKKWDDAEVVPPT